MTPLTLMNEATVSGLSADDIRAMVAFLRRGGEYFEPKDMRRYEVEHLIWRVAETFAERM